ncbi:hypothetical protein U1Q18_025199 [Sarracenia purpurea var. burkii]
MGSFKGLKQLRRIVEDCMQNKMHPVYHIKILMLKKELAKDPALADENWDRFLPMFKKYDVYSIDLQLESGEYFLSDKKKSAKKWQEKQEKQMEKTAESKRKREEAFIPPKKPSRLDSGTYNDTENDVTAMAISLKEKAKESGKQKALGNIDATKYIATGEPSLKKKSRRDET